MTNVQIFHNFHTFQNEERRTRRRDGRIRDDFAYMSLQSIKLHPDNELLVPVLHSLHALKTEKDKEKIVIRNEITRRTLQYTNFQSIKLNRKYRDKK